MHRGVTRRKPGGKFLGFLALMLTLLVAGAGIIGLRQWSDRQRTARLGLLEIAKGAAHLSAVEWATVTRPDAEVHSANELELARRELFRSIEALRDGAASDEVVQRATALLTTYNAAVDWETQFLRAGELTDADRYDEQVVHPAFVAFGNYLERVEVTFDHRAAVSAKTADFGMVGLLVAAVALMLLLNTRRSRAVRGLQITAVEQAMAEQNAHNLRLLFDRNPECMWLCEPDSFAIIAVNDAAVTRYGYERNAFLLMTVDDLMVTSFTMAQREQVRAGGTIDPGEPFRHRRANGDIATVELSSDWVPHEGRNVLMVVAHDVTERVLMENQLRHLAYHDSLTGLGNRALLLDRMDESIGRTAGRDSRTALLLVDLDGFKAVNDTFGHNVGDDLLVEVGRRLRTIAPAEDTLGRLGGDEFGVIVDEEFGSEVAVIVAQRARAALERPFDVQGRAIHISSSIGIAFADDVLTTGQHLLRAADVAMYAAKVDGGNAFREYEPGMHDALLQRLELEGELRRALVSGAVDVAYQPVFDLGTRDIVGFEALARWCHPTRGVISPIEFISIAEGTGMIRDLGRQILEAACRDAAQWPATPNGDLPFVSVNVSVKQLNEIDFVDMVKGILRRSGLNPRRLTIEITESLFMSNTDVLLPRLRHLHRLGVRLAIDDFGTGYSSLAYLQHFPIDILKIDKVFVDPLQDASEDGALAQAVVRIGQALSILTVAEGVETEWQAQRLRDIGCNRGQGYLCSAPVPALDVFALLGAHEPAAVAVSA